MDSNMIMKGLKIGDIKPLWAVLILILLLTTLT